ncbi:PAS/PAC sensor hybrid histidine kinase [Nostoc commune NIES-4072]|uniref:histidine kinase n=1 Tax=Nostoc commune NIES-4072 TaxID=2005467 RepID=A0A2R5FQY2_NOSCO|nr:ATP-binding protein [Nostoc commune]BBD64452.1 PAS/PAC sensor hybrid histidine kinase [Nostoc commune HK-02]GBG18221.1 PAS/PAC sensor hybrid histidine kinase [Nostoc commune NIES-4072]
MTKAKILVVEDEAIVAKDLQLRLIKFGYTVPAIASSGEEAINKAVEISPDLVLMDIKLKGTMDGIEAAEEIYKRLDIPVIYLTAYADENTLTRAKITEPFAYLIKPFKERELQINIEITLTKHGLEKQLKVNQKWLDTLLKSISDGVIASDMQELVTFMNPVAENLTGWKQEEACGRNSSEIFNIANAETHDSLESPIIKVLQNGIIISIPAETILITKDGGEIPIDDSAAPIKDDQDNITGAVLVFRDITERKRAIETRKKQIEQEQLLVQWEEINQLKNDFLNLVSHELRSPLGNIKLMIQMIQLSPLTEEAQRYLELMEGECDRELGLINDLLDLQRLENSYYPVMTPDSLLLQQWLPWVIEPFQIRVQEHQQTLQINLASNLPPLFSDGINLERILVELLNNACKYTPAGGEIVLSVRHNSLEVPAKTIITISNSAEIPVTELPRIFEKFYRIPNADIWNQGGSGLGLPIVQKLVKQLQGNIQVESNNGWTTFTVTLTDL